MNTRAELEAELKETQELERYMKTLLDDRIRQCEQLEATNAALTKRAAELEACNANLTCDMNAFRLRCESLQFQLDCGQDGPCAKSPGCNRHWEERNRELAKRVAELEEELRRRAELYTSNETVLRQMCEDLQWHIRNLQSQLEVKDKRVAELEHEAMMLRGSIAARDEISERHLRVREELAQQVLDLQSQLEWTPVSAGLPTEPGLYEFTVGGIVHVFRLTETGAWGKQPGRTLDARGISAIFSGYTNCRRIELPKDGGT